MSAGSTMELNAKSPFFWDWENLVMFNAKTEVPKKHQLVDSEIEAIGGFEAGSLHSSGGRSDGASASGGAASDFGWSSTKSSKSASTDSSMNKEIKESKFTLETIERLQQDLSSNKELLGSVPARTSSAIEGSVGSGESLIGLKLGKRTYFEAVSAGGNAKHSGMVTIVPDSTGKRCKTSSLSTEVPRCQVEGCNLDLSSAKDYHRKHRVCENHSKSPKVIINGVERRFCQQCSRFHGLSEFDQRKRSCRRRLTDHNARRRKPKPEVIQFNSMRLSSSLFEDRNHMSLAFNQEPLVQTRPDINSTWDSTSNSKCTQGKLSLFNSTKSGNVGALHVPDSGLEYLSTKPCSESANFLPSKGASSEVFSRGIPVAMTSGNLHGGQDHLRALSLLSTNTWGSCDPDNSPLDHPMHGATHQPFPTMQAAPLGPLCEYWQDEQPVTSGSSFQRNDDDNSSQFQEFQLFKAPNEPGFYLY